jgi:hypothetical protein
VAVRTSGPQETVEDTSPPLGTNTTAYPPGRTSFAPLTSPGR